MLKEANKVENTVLEGDQQGQEERHQGCRRSPLTRRSRQQLQRALSPRTRRSPRRGETRERGREEVRDAPGTPSVIFPGACADVALGDVADCVNTAARCEACLKIEGVRWPGPGLRRGGQPDRQHELPGAGSADADTHADAGCDTHAGRHTHAECDAHAVALQSGYPQRLKRTTGARRVVRTDD